jgi:hypothetical protein
VLPERRQQRLSAFARQRRRQPPPAPLVNAKLMRIFVRLRDGGHLTHSYAVRLRRHLAEYKQSRLGIRQDGLWVKNRKPYSHILPRKLRRLNILETVRAEFWNYRREERLKLHRDFHHLTSSQALGFNLFFPFFGLRPQRPEFILRALGAPEGSIEGWAFEKVLDPAEGTNFDFHITLVGGRHIYFEVKLCERGFGKVKANERHLKKLDEIYRERLLGKVGPDSLAEKTFFRNYQLLRNISYLSPDLEHQLVIICPQANEALREGLSFLEGALTAKMRGGVRVVYLEPLLTELRVQSRSEPRLGAHAELLEEKYALMAERTA